MSDRQLVQGWRRVRVPACANHGGVLWQPVILEWKCPECSGPRGEPEIRACYCTETGKCLPVHHWGNPCGHRDSYRAVLAENLSHRAPVAVVLEMQGRKEVDDLERLLLVPDLRPDPALLQGLPGSSGAVPAD